MILSYKTKVKIVGGIEVFLWTNFWFDLWEWLMFLTHVWPEWRSCRSWSAWRLWCWGRPPPPWRSEGCRCSSSTSGQAPCSYPAVQHKTFHHQGANGNMLGSRNLGSTLPSFFFLLLHQWWDNSWCGGRRFRSGSRCSLQGDWRQTWCRSYKINHNERKQSGW